MCIFNAHLMYRTLQRYVESTEEIFYHLGRFNPENRLGNWFTVMSFHLWLVNVRLRYEGYQGGQMQHEIFQKFWTDFKERLDEDVGHPVLVARYKHAAKERYHGFWIALDYGMLSGDAYLADSIFRNFFGPGEGRADPRAVELMVKYTHRVLLNLDFHPDESINSGLLCFPKLCEEFQEIQNEISLKNNKQ